MEARGAGTFGYSGIRRITPATVGEDVINGGDGDDLIFGDEPNTDALAVAESLGTPPDAGWLVFADLEADVGNATSDPAGGRGRIACVSGFMVSETAARKRPLSIVAQLYARRTHHTRSLPRNLAHPGYRCTHP